MTKLYALNAVEELLQRYVNKDPNTEIIEVIPGSLGYGTTVVIAEGLKTAIIQERYLNEWSSGHTIRLYNKTPKKYLDLIEKYYTQLEKEEAC